MTESDIYQLVGKAYCDGVSHGMEKSAEFDPSTALGRDGIHPDAEKLKPKFMFNAKPQFDVSKAEEFNAARKAMIKMLRQNAQEFDPSTALGRDGIHPAAQKKALEGMKRVSMGGKEAIGPTIPFIATPWNYAKRPDDAKTGMKSIVWTLQHPISNVYNGIDDTTSSIRKLLHGE